MVNGRDSQSFRVRDSRGKFSLCIISQFLLHSLVLELKANVRYDSIVITFV